MIQRKTRQRQLVLDALMNRFDHPSADQIYLEVRLIDHRISRGTVYRNLNVLEQAGDVLRVKLPWGDRYELRPDKHHHVICTGCKAVCDLPIRYDETLDNCAAEQSGYLVARHRTFFEGLCPECRKKSGNKN